MTARRVDQRPLRGGRRALRGGRRALGLWLGGLVLATLVAIGGVELARARRAPVEPVFGSFALVDQEGRAVTDASYRGKWLLVTFGYTGCPDACPTVMATLADALDGLGALRSQVQPLLVTVDPGQDTPAVLKGYTEAFQAGIVGLTGSEAQIARAAESFRVAYRRERGPDGATSIAHSAGIFLIDPAGRFVTFFDEQAEPAAIRERLRRHAG